MMRVIYSLGTICLSIVQLLLELWSCGRSCLAALAAESRSLSLQGKRTVKIDSVWWRCKTGSCSAQLGVLHRLILSIPTIPPFCTISALRVDPAAVSQTIYTETVMFNISPNSSIHTPSVESDVDSYQKIRNNSDHIKHGVKSEL